MYNKMLSKECKYDNNDLEYGDIVLVDGGLKNGLTVGMIKSTYHDGSTDCSWHYIIVSKDKQPLDLSGSDIVYKLTGPDAEILKSYILDGKLLEDKELGKAKIINSIKYYQEQIRSNEVSLKMNKGWLEDTLKEYKEFTGEDFIL